MNNFSTTEVKTNIKVKVSVFGNDERKYYYALKIVFQIFLAKLYFRLFF